MYIWTAIDINKQLLNEKAIVKQIEDETGFEESNVFGLPLHVSLKISAEIKDSEIDSVRKDIIALFMKTPKFKMQIRGIELNDSIVWIRIEPNKYLNQLHESICKLFKDKYNVELHEFDKEFIYHATLFLDSDIKKIKEAYLKIKDIELPKELEASSFIIGSSSSGKIGTYHVDLTISK